MTESVKARIGKLPDALTAQELRPILAAIVDALQVTGAKLDAETSLATKNYASTINQIIQD